jgi:hypothetical protein
MDPYWSFQCWRLSLNFIPVCYYLVLHRSQWGYFSSDVQSCKFILQLYIMDIPISLYAWILLFPLSKQLVDWKRSKMMLCSPKVVWGRPDWVVVERNLQVGYSLIGTTTSAEENPICCFFWDKSILGVIVQLRCISLGGSPYRHPEWSIIILPCISPKVSRGIYSIRVRVDLPELHVDIYKHRVGSHYRQLSKRYFCDSFRDSNNWFCLQSCK